MIQVGLALCLIALAAGCGPGVPVSGADGGVTRDGGSAPVGTWHLFFPSDHRDGHVVENACLAKGAPEPGVAWQPTANDPWLLDLTPRTFDRENVCGPGIATYHFALAIDGDTVTVTGQLNSHSSGNGWVTAVAVLSHLTWCYRPAARATKVRFAARMTAGGVTVTGREGEAVVELAHFGGGPCLARAQATGGVLSKTPAACLSQHIDVSEAADGVACLGGDGDDPILELKATGGSVDAPGTSVAIAKATFTVTATPVP